MTPEFLRHVFISPRDGYVVEIATGEARFMRESGQSLTALGRIDLTQGDIPPIDLEKRIGVRRSDLRRAGLTLRIAPEAALHKRLTLPIAAEADLRDVLSFEIDRLTPFKRTEALFTYDVLRRDTIARQLDVKIIVVPKTTVDHALGVLSRIGIEPDAVEPACGDGRDGSGDVAQLQISNGGKGDHVIRAVLGSLAFLTFMLVVLVLYLPLRQDRVVVDRLTAEMTEARIRVDDAVRLRAESLARGEDQGRLRERKKQTYAVIELLEEVSRILPDHTHLTLLELNGGQLMLVGNSALASTVLSLIEESPMFERTSFRAPVTQDPRLLRERFQIVTHISARPVK